MKATAFFLLQVAFTLCTFCAFMLLQKVKQMFIKIVTPFFGCESSPISRNVRSFVRSSVSQSVSPQMQNKVK